MNNYHVNRNPKQTRIVITGLGTINPIANTVDEFWENLVKGKSGIRKIQHHDLGDFSVQIGGEVDIPDLQGIMHKKWLKRLDRYIIFGNYAAKHAFIDSGLDQEIIDKNPHRYGVIIGTGDAGLDLSHKMSKNIYEKGMDYVSAFYIVGKVPNTPPGFFAREHNFQGPNYSVSSACATSNHAIGTAAMLIKMGMADVAMAGGTEGVVVPSAIAAFAKIMALSQRNDDPQTASRPFDKDRDGFILGEGSGVICLEELEHAKKRGAKIYGELTGIGFSCDAYDLVAPHPEGRGAMISMKSALENAELETQDIDLINAHGTSTPMGDKAEALAIEQLFGNKVPVHSTKSMLGHLIGAAGGTEAIAAILAIQKGVIHPSMNVFELDPGVDINVVANKPIEKKVKHVLSNSFGFGGQNSTIIISEFND